ncbi:hypothetical protein LZ554_003072 [Drepanopeziza brunnea f. sp. 'monogermtubi']|nr:hypothetical protein LZ554_003072 [Drepanopeziza brunnea f. sp. 'monogermtubi']
MDTKYATPLSERISDKGRLKYEDYDEDYDNHEAASPDEGDVEHKFDFGPFYPRDYSKVVLPASMKYPRHLLIVNHNSFRHPVMKQFVKPHTWAKRLLKEKGNEQLNLSAMQIKAAYATAVTQAKDGVNRTELRESNPGLNAKGIQMEFDRQIQEVISQVETKNIQSKDEILADLRTKMASGKHKGRIGKLLKQERALLDPQAFGAEVKAKKDAKKKRREEKYGKKGRGHPAAEKAQSNTEYVAPQHQQGYGQTNFSTGYGPSQHQQGYGLSQYQ